MDIASELQNDENSEVNKPLSTRKGSSRASICGIELQDYTPTKSVLLGLSPNNKMKRKMDEVAHEPDSDDDTDYWDSPAEPSRTSLSPLPAPPLGRSPSRSPAKRHNSGKRLVLPSPSPRRQKRPELSQPLVPSQTTSTAETKKTSAPVSPTVAEKAHTDNVHLSDTVTHFKATSMPSLVEATFPSDASPTAHQMERERVVRTDVATPAATAPPGVMEAPIKMQVWSRLVEFNVR